MSADSEKQDKIEAVVETEDVEEKIEMGSQPDSTSTGPPPEANLAAASVTEPARTEDITTTEPRYTELQQTPRSDIQSDPDVQRLDTRPAVGDKHTASENPEQIQRQQAAFVPHSVVWPDLASVTEESSDDEQERLVIAESEPGTSYVTVGRPSVAEGYDDYHPAVLEMSESSIDSIGSIQEGQLPTTIESVEEKPIKLSTTSSGKWWHYLQNIKGPKKEMFDIKIPLMDNPYQTKAFEDPAAKGAYPGVAHSARTRLGEGNDITPSVSMLKSCKQNIDYIAAQIEGIDEPSRRKEKMVLSSRLSRVRKRANHEANKIIFAGLDAEREGLISALRKLKDQMKLDESRRVMPLQRYCDMLTENLPPPVAGHKEDYVDSMLALSDDESD